MNFIDKLRGKADVPTPSPPSKSLPLHITIGAMGNEGLNVDTDLRLLRSALVYGHRVKLCSFMVGQVLEMFNLTTLSPEEYLDWYKETFLSYEANLQRRASQAQTIDYFKELYKKKRRGKRLSKHEQDALRTAQSLRTKMNDESKQKYPALNNESDLNGIKKAIKSGLIELHTFQTLNQADIGRRYVAGEELHSFDDFYREYTELLAEAVKNKQTHPLFDDRSGTLVRLAIQGKTLSPSKIKVQQAKS